MQKSTGKGGSIEACVIYLERNQFIMWLIQNSGHLWAYLLFIAICWHYQYGMSHIQDIRSSCEEFGTNVWVIMKSQNRDINTALLTKVLQLLMFMMWHIQAITHYLRWLSKHEVKLKESCQVIFIYHFIQHYITLCPIQTPCDTIPATSILSVHIRRDMADKWLTNGHKINSQSSLLSRTHNEIDKVK